MGGNWDETGALTPYLVAQFASQALLELASSYDLGGGGLRRIASFLPQGLSMPLEKTQAERQGMTPGHEVTSHWLRKSKGQSQRRVGHKM